MKVVVPKYLTNVVQLEMVIKVVVERLLKVHILMHLLSKSFGMHYNQ